MTGEASPMDSIIKTICGVFLAVGLVLSGIVAYFVRDTLAFLDHAVTVRGEVVELEFGDSSRSGGYYPIVKYSTRDGQKQTFRGMVGTSPPSFQVGEAVDVLYD